MTTSHDTRQFNINSYWGPREETLEAIANRYIRMVEALARIDPVFTPWFFVGDGKVIPFDQARVRLPALLAKCVGRDWGPAEGYRLGGANAKRRNPRIFELRGEAGNSMPPVGYSNSVQLQTADQFAEPTDASIVTYDLFRSAMLAIIEAWDVTWCASFPTDIMKFWPPAGSGHPFKLAWMTYVSPRFASLIRPPRGIESQAVAGGGVLMVATRERFDVTNTGHMAAARAIDTAMAPLNALPWPPDP